MISHKCMLCLIIAFSVYLVNGKIRYSHFSHTLFSTRSNAMRCCRCIVMRMFNAQHDRQCIQLNPTYNFISKNSVSANERRKRSAEVGQIAYSLQSLDRRWMERLCFRSVPVADFFSIAILNYDALLHSIVQQIVKGTWWKLPFLGYKHIHINWRKKDTF